MNQVDGDFIKWFATLGVGGVLAGFMFVFYRKDVKAYTELWRSTAELLIQTIKDNTTALSKLIVMLETQERNALRKDDLQALLDIRKDKDK